MAGTNQVVLGHRTAAGWFVDAVATRTITAGTDYTLLVALDNSPEAGGDPTVNVVLNGQSAVGFAYHFQTVGAGSKIGLLARNGTASFDNVSIRGNDQAYAGGGTPQLAASPIQPGALTVTSLTSDQFNRVIQAALERLAASPVFARDVSLLQQASFAIADLPGQMVGQTIGTSIVIDPTAAGLGWYIDVTPLDDSEFSKQKATGELVATGSSPAAGRMDLLTVVMHELGHLLGQDDINNVADPSELMDATLPSGVRRLPDGLAPVQASTGSSAVSTEVAALPSTVMSGASLTDEIRLTGTAIVAALPLPSTAFFDQVISASPPMLRSGKSIRASQVDAVFAALANRGSSDSVGHFQQVTDEVLLAEVSWMRLIQRPAVVQPASAAASKQDAPRASGLSPRTGELDLVHAALSDEASRKDAFAASTALNEEFIMPAMLDSVSDPTADSGPEGHVSSRTQGK